MTFVRRVTFATQERVDVLKKKFDVLTDGMDNWKMPTSFPTVIKIVAKIKIARMKLAIGPAETIIALWYKGLVVKSLS